jgi:acyl dehydratase
MGADSPRPRVGHPFEYFTPGRVFRAGPSEPLGEAEIIAFGRAWDPQRFHVDPEGAKNSIYGGIIASGMHTMCIMFKLLELAGEFGDYFEGGLGADKLKWPHPVRPGDRLSVVMEVTGARPSKSRPDCGIVTSIVTTTNQDGATVLTMVSADLLRRAGHEAG